MDNKEKTPVSVFRDVARRKGQRITMEEIKRYLEDRRKNHLISDH